MLKVFRKKGVMKKILWFLAGVIIVVFGFLGESYLLSGGGAPNYAGEVFGRKVSLDEFRRHFQQTQIQAMIQYGENFKKVSEFLDLEAETWDRIILLDEAKRRRIRISDEEVVEAIQNYGFFKRDGEFDNILYEDVLRFVFRITPRAFEEGTRETLKYSKLYDLETSGITVDEEEIFDSYRKSYEKVQISYVLFDAIKYKEGIPFDANKAREYYQSHKAEFIQPLMVNVQYFRFDYSPEGDGLLQEDALEAAMKAADDLSANPDFETIAQKHNITLHTTGFFSQEKPDLKAGWTFPVIQKIFKLPVGQIEGPVETINGYQILSVREKKESAIPRYEDVMDKVKEAWLNAEAKKLAYQDAVASITALKEAYNSVKRPDFVAIAKDLGLDLNQTPVFVRGQYLPNIGISKDFQEASFQLNEDNRLSNLIEIEKGYCLLHLDSVVPVNRDDYQKQRDAFKGSLLSQKKNAVFTDFLTYLRLKADLKNYVSNQQRGDTPN